MNRIPPEFRSNRHLLLKRPRPDSSTAQTSGAATAPLDGKSAEMNRVDHIGSESEVGGEPMGGLMAFKAFGIATAVVLGSAGLGAFGIAKFLGVNDVCLPLHRSL